MSEETIAFKCGSCKQVPDKPLLKDKNFEIVAIEDAMDWADFKHDTPDLNTEIWERALKPPAKGDLSILMRSTSLRLLNVDLKTSYPKMKKKSLDQDYNQPFGGIWIVGISFQHGLLWKSNNS
ncbi:hypothetical protein [Paenibacillus polymyxa]|uniref:hypothetical protein n=1 Tax=Paenibacillus polymyxa TaxID=1406 RepID=UPI002379F3E1|nr:hypothetical protein [Paenibacillus polymyxa]